MKTQSKLENGRNGQSSVKLNHDSVLRALYDFDDLMHRCLTQSVYLSLGDVGKAIKENVEFNGKELEFGLERRYVTKEVLFTLKSFSLPDTEFTDDGFSYEFGGVPIKVKFIKQNYKFFEHPDKLVYYGGEFQIPNPFDRYYKARWIIH